MTEKTNTNAMEEGKTVEKPVEQKTETAKPTEKKKAAKVVKKDVAIARSNSVHASLKHSMFISKFIKGKTVDVAISDLRKVIALKKAVPFKGEIPHRKGKMMSGRYPVNASKAFIALLRALRGNILANGMELDKAVIVSSNPSWASRPMRRGGVHAKRVNLVVEAREKEVKAHG